MDFLRKIFNQKPLGNQPKVGGYIAYFKLEGWWINSFTESERQTIQSLFSPMGDGSRLTEGNVQSLSGPGGNAPMTLIALAGYLYNPEYFYLSKRILEKAEELSSVPGASIRHLNFTYEVMIKNYYRSREVHENALQEAIAACEKQISIAPRLKKVMEAEKEFTATPSGFIQLSVIHYKQGDYHAVIKVCEEAKNQGWGGDWEKRIQKASKALSRQKS